MRFVKNAIYRDETTTMNEKWFALFPVTIGEETRWLEFVTVQFGWCNGYNIGCISPGWYKIKFIDK